MKEEVKKMVRERDANKWGEIGIIKFHGQQDPEEQRGIMLSGRRLLSALAQGIRHPSLANEGYVKRL